MARARRGAAENALSAAEKIVALFRSGEAGLISLLAGYAGRQLRESYMQRRAARRRFQAEVDHMGVQLRQLAEEQARQQLRKAYRDAYLRIQRLEWEALADAIDEDVNWFDEELSEVRDRAEAKVQELLDDLNAQFLESLRHMRRQADDVYRQVVEASAEGETRETVRKGVQDALNNFAKRGVDGFQDRAGRNWGLPEYAEMAVRTAVQRMSLLATIDAMFDQDRDLCFVNPHPGSCPMCAPWEGKILSLTGRTPDYPTLRQAMDAGLFHPNCAHVLHVYIPGVSEPSIGRPGMTDLENRRLFLARQRQRYMEREVRKNKRLLAAALTPEEEKKAKANIAYWQKHLNELVEENPMLVRRYDREAVRGAELPGPPQGGIMGESTEAGGGNVEIIGKIDPAIYSCMTSDILTDEVVLLDKQILHIKDHHPGDYERFSKYIRTMLEEPDYIIEANKNPDKSGLVLKRFEEEGQRFRLVLRLKTSELPENYKNSVITFQYTHEKEYSRLIRNKRVLYKRPGL